MTWQPYTHNFQLTTFSTFGWVTIATGLHLLVILCTTKIQCGRLGWWYVCWQHHRSNCWRTWAMDGRIMCYSIISCDSAATSETIKRFSLASWLKIGGAGSCSFPTYSCKFLTEEILCSKFKFCPKFPQNGGFQPKFCISQHFLTAQNLGGQMGNCPPAHPRRHWRFWSRGLV